MKIKLFIVFVILLANTCFSQISYISKSVGLKQVNKKELEEFKKKEVVFVLPETYSLSQYEKILKESWDSTPYKVVHSEEFVIEDYLNEKYSIATINSIDQVRSTNLGMISSVYICFDVLFLNHQNIKQKRKTSSLKKWNKKKNEYLFKNSKLVARFYLFPISKYLGALQYGPGFGILKKGLGFKIGKKDNVYRNYNLGFLKNYLQKVNSLIKIGEPYDMFDDGYLPELKNLTNQTLYVPKYLGVTFNPFIVRDKNKGDDKIVDLFKKYKYSYEIISEEEISNKILAGDEFYYVRYARTNAEIFLQVVNSKTGEVVFRNYSASVSYNLKTKEVTKISKKIKKSSKK